MNKKEVKDIQYSICVSGAAQGHTIDTSATLAYELGQYIAEAGHILTTGATVGLPYHSAVGAKDHGGSVIGFSPASSLREHVKKYRLPYDCFDFINFTGMNYVGRDLYLVQSSDAVITIGGRFGSLHEFTSALEAGKPCGILIGSGGTADIIPALMQALEPPADEVVIYDDNPKRLVERVLEIVNKEYTDIRRELKEHDQHWFLRKAKKPKT